eukprot:9414120-Prorocentrum_lima.AAC.1
MLHGKPRPGDSPLLTMHTWRQHDDMIPPTPSAHDIDMRRQGWANLLLHKCRSSASACDWQADTRRTW